MTNIERQIKEAIARSISHNEIVHITIDGDSGDALAAIEAVTENTDTDYDYTMADYEGVDGELTHDVSEFLPA